MAVWLDDAVEAHVLAAWSQHVAPDWFALIPDSVVQEPERAAVVDGLLSRYSRVAHSLCTRTDPMALAGLLACVTRAVDAGADTLCLPARRDKQTSCLVARINATNDFLNAWGLNALVLPFWQATDHDVVRLGLALDAPWPFRCDGKGGGGPHAPNCLQWHQACRSLGLVTPCSLGRYQERGDH